MKKICALIGLLLALTLCLTACGEAVGIAGAAINENGELILTLTDGTEQNAGKVKGETGENAANENPQGLDFYLLPDGTYGVKAGKAIYLEEIVIPETYYGKKVTQILSFAYDDIAHADLNLKKITIPSSVTSIAKGAFSSLATLEAVIFSPNSSLTTIGEGAFFACSSLTSIEIPASVTSIGTGAFNNCSSLASATISAGVTSIGEHAFYHCSSLASIKIPAGVTSIGSYAFDSCSSLASIEIPTSVTFIGGSAFWACSNLSAVYYGGGIVDWANVHINGGSNSYIMNAPRYYYAEAKPEANHGSYWHYVDGVPTVWTENG